ncbi:MAG: hypothetical protein IRZ33_10030 [Alicyclobacillaceae bacterium]|nr:hypothetical protein [Alicyclobacillaceae bacterium]
MFRSRLPNRAMGRTPFGQPTRTAVGDAGQDDAFDADGTHSRWRPVVEAVDNVLIPVAFGLLSTLALAQMAACIPVVRDRLDARAGRLVAVRTEAGSTAPAIFSMYVSPAVPHPDVEVWVNGQRVADFQRPGVTVTVRDGDRVELRAMNLSGTVWIRIDHDDPGLLSPAPGQVYELTGARSRVLLPTVQVQ